MTDTIAELRNRIIELEFDLDCARRAAARPAAPEPADAGFLRLAWQTLHYASDQLAVYGQHYPETAVMNALPLLRKALRLLAASGLSETWESRAAYLDFQARYAEWLVENT